MGNNKSFLKLSSVDITSKLFVRIPTVGEILDNEQSYYSIISSLTATPFQYMVQLDDLEIDFTRITDYQLFMMLLPNFTQGDTSIIFGNIDLSDIRVRPNNQNDTQILYSPKNDIIIDEFIYIQLVDALRKINNIEKFKGKPGNEAAKKYLIDKERKRQKRRANKPYESYLEKLVIALVNSPEFKYNYEEVMDLSIYKFNQSFKQIQTRITFDKTMIGVYSGTVDTSKLNDQSCLSWLQIK